MPSVSITALTPARVQKANQRFTQFAKLAVIYWLLKYVLLDGYRHLRARGLVRTANEGVQAIKDVCTLLYELICLFV